jgi:hypothetical protein
VTHATWLPDVLRAAGLTVKTYDGWKGRGGGFTDLSSVVWHHDASPPGDSPGVPAYMIRQIDAGRAGAQLWVDRRGVWHVVAAGKVSHAGKVRPGMPGNSNSLGIETDHTTGERWPTVQLASLRHGTAAILRRLGTDASGLHMHKTICDPPGRKVDPDGLDLHTERGRIAVLMATRPAPAPEPAPPPVQEVHKVYVIFNDPTSGKTDDTYGSDGMTKFRFESQEAKNGWATRFKADRVPMDLPTFDAIPTVERAQ